MRQKHESHAKAECDLTHAFELDWGIFISAPLTSWTSAAATPVACLKFRSYVDFATYDVITAIW
jgi:hypothetical protein